MSGTGVVVQVRDEVAALAELCGRAAGHRRVEFLRMWVRYPLRYRASLRCATVPMRSVAQVLAEFDVDEIVLRRAEDESDRREWGLRLVDQRVLVAMARAIRARRVFEIGTFDGGTTALLADAVGEGGLVWTLDLPPEDFDATQSLEDFDGSMIGRRFQGTAVEGRITQLLGNSRTFDVSPWAASMDLVFIDAAHDYSHGKVDSINAFRLVRPGGLVVWDDFDPHFWGLVEAVLEVVGDLPITRIEGTSLAYAKVPELG